MSSSTRTPPRSPARVTPRPRPGSAAARQQARRRARLWLWGAGTAIVALAVVIAIFAAGGGGDGDGATAAPDAVTAVGASLPALPDAGPDGAVGMEAPILRGADFDGTPVTIEATGSPLLITVFAHWCPHCQRELPVIVDHLAAGGLAGVQVVGVSTAVDASRGNFPPDEWFAREGFDRPVLVDTADQRAGAALGVKGFPTWILVNGDGTVAARTSGELTAAQMEAFVAQAE